MAKKKAPSPKLSVKSAAPARKIKTTIKSGKEPSRQTLKAAAPGHSPASPITAIGASAGGLEAFRRLLGALPSDTRLSFVIIQHLSPTHESILPEILAKAAPLPVLEARDGMKLDEAKIYVIPPNASMTIKDGRLRLLPREGVAHHMPIDIFFRSLAEHPGQAIGIILSGAGTDGSLGLQEIKDSGGITFAQDEKSAKFDGMPRSAVATGAVDFVLTPEEIAGELTRICKQLQSDGAPFGKAPSKGAEDFHAIFTMLRRLTGVDFSLYKQKTVMRRITRRMFLFKMGSVAEYQKYLRENPSEVQALYQDILIKVTSFFRDPQAFEALKETIIPEILDKRTADVPVRFWVAGCSTGEEAYSLAIVLLECLGDMSSNTDVQIFATDISEEALNKARSGIYLENIALDVSPERLRRFFVRTNSYYQIAKHIRDMCIFARHDVTRDHPFSRIDLISCRNLLIYFDTSLQKRVIPTFHYALNPNGYLLLGNSETVGGFAELYTLKDKKNKIYAKKLSPSRFAIPMRGQASFPNGPPDGPQPAREIAWSGSEVQREADRVALAAYMPPGAVINGDMDIIQFRGQTGPFLEPAPGTASLNLLKMIRSPLLLELRRTIEKAKKQDKPARTKDVPLEVEGKLRKVDIEAVPLLSASGNQETYYLVMFLEHAPAADAKPAKSPKVGKAKDERQTTGLRKELDAAKEYLQSIIEEHEATNEELKSANEEILSSNEELQSINEELETAKEELQSTNEELTTLNEELHNRNDDLNMLNNDMSNLLSSLNVPIVMLGGDMRIRRFTPIAEKVLNLIPADVGRPFSDIKSSVPPDTLQKMVLEVIDTMSVKEMEIQTESGQWYSLRIRPYRTMDNKIDGAVLVFIDIDSLKTGLRLLKEARAYSEGIVETVRTPLLVLDAEGTIRTANQAYLKTFPESPSAIQGRSLLDLGYGGRPIPGIRELILGSNWTQPLLDHEVEIPHPAGARALLLNAFPLQDEEGRKPLVLLSLEDITDRKRAENVLKNTVAELESFSYSVSHDLRAPLRAMQGVAEALLEDHGDRLEPTGRDFAHRIVASAHRMDALIQDLLTYSRVCQTEREMRICSLDEAVDEAMKQLEKEIQDRGAEVMVARPLGRVLGHRTLLATVFLNLIGNAIKFVATGTVPKVYVHSRKTDGMVRVSVEDNGIGIESEHQKRIFRVFERLHGVEKYPGTGIGLAIVRKGTEGMNGKVGLESKPGEGSNFWIELPAGEEKP